MNELVLEERLPPNQLATLYEVGVQLGRTLDLPQVLTQVMDSLIQLTGAERGFLILRDDDSDVLRTVAARNVAQETIHEDERFSHTVVQRVLDSGEGLLTDNAQQDARFAGKDSVVAYQLRSVMCAPLETNGRVLGAVYVDNRLMTGVFRKSDLDLLMIFATQAANAIENARLFTQTGQALARRVKELSLFQRIDQQLGTSLDLNRVLSLALNWAIALTNADGGSIGLMATDEDEPAQGLHLLAYRGVREEDPVQHVPLTHPVLQQVLTQKKSVITRGVSEAESNDGSPARVQPSMDYVRR